MSDSQVSDVVSWILELSIKEGEVETLKALMSEMVEATQANEPGALIYEWFISEDETSCHIYERYADSAAVMTHLGNFQTHFGKRFMSILTPKRMIVYGNANEKVRGALSTMGAQFLGELGGFAR